MSFDYFFVREFCLKSNPARGQKFVLNCITEIHMGSFVLLVNICVICQTVISLFIIFVMNERENQ